MFSALITACSTPLPPRLPPQPGSIPAKVEQLGEMSYLQITDLAAVKRAQLLTIQAEFNNPTNDNHQLFYRFKWLDASGFVVGGEEAWKPLGLYGLQKQTVMGVAPSPQVTDFRLQVQSPENTGELPN
jgi:hypothetical protein